MPGTVTAGVEAAPGALGSGPVVTVGLGADGRVLCGAVAPGAVCVPAPRVTFGSVATMVVLDPDVVAAETAVATMATTRKRSAGHTQSPGYQGTPRCQAAASTPTGPRLAGRRSAHSRQYSWSGSYATPQRAQYCGSFGAVPLIGSRPAGRTGRRSGRPRRLRRRTRSARPAARVRARPRRRSACPAPRAGPRAPRAGCTARAGAPAGTGRGGTSPASARRDRGAGLRATATAHVARGAGGRPAAEHDEPRARTAPARPPRLRDESPAGAASARL